MRKQVRTKGKLGNMVKVGAFSPTVHVGNPLGNAIEIVKGISDNDELRACDIVVTPELSITGYTCQDTFFNSQVLRDVHSAIEYIIHSISSDMLVSVGAPLVYNGKLMNCSVLLRSGGVVSVTPKTYLPNYSEYYEHRWFTPASDVELGGIIEVGEHGNKDILLNKNIVNVEIGSYKFTGGDNNFKADKQFLVGSEICEDLWAPNPPSTDYALSGAQIILNNSASNEIIGKAAYRRDIVKTQSAKTISAYVYCSAGYSESVQDIVFGGHNIIAENGKILAESDLFDTEMGVVVADIDLDRLNHDRLVNKTFSSYSKPGSEAMATEVRMLKCGTQEKEIDRTVDIMPFVPRGNDLAERCIEIFNIQVAALAQRWKTVGSKCVVIGVSGGLDSTLALLVAIGAADRLKRSRKDVLGVTMPCLGTTDRTKGNALTLMEELGCESMTVDICASVKQHLKDIGLSENDRSVAYENAQARERTQVLMDIANMRKGFVIGTGDLSELALGWCTYNGDHMSMYSVNSTIPKTLVRSMVNVIGKKLGSSVVADILDTPVSPELLPPDESGKIQQLTENSVGPYVLNDFFMYYHVRFGMDKDKIMGLAHIACKQSAEYNYDDETIEHWLNLFYKRFYGAQFKRNCCPDGVKVGSVSFNPRGDWRCPTEFIGHMKFLG